jgi:hypothetical protein
MTVENVAKDNRYDINKKFLQNFHNKVLGENKIFKNEKGERMTMLTSTVGTGENTHYILPALDSKTGKELSSNEILKKYKSAIESGLVKSYNTYKEAEKERSKMRKEILGIK